MSRQDFERIAYALRTSHPRELGYDPGTDEFFYREREWQTVASRQCWKSADGGGSSATTG